MSRAAQSAFCDTARFETESTYQWAFNSTIASVALLQRSNADRDGPIAASQRVQRNQTSKKLDWSVTQDTMTAAAYKKLVTDEDPITRLELYSEKASRLTILTSWPRIRPRARIRAVSGASTHSD